MLSSDKSAEALVQVVLGGEGTEALVQLLKGDEPLQPVVQVLLGDEGGEALVEALQRPLELLAGDEALELLLQAGGARDGQGLGGPQGLLLADARLAQRLVHLADHRRHRPPFQAFTFKRRGPPGPPRPPRSAS